MTNEVSQKINKSKSGNSPSLLFTDAHLSWLADFIRNTDEGRTGWNKMLEKVPKTEEQEPGAKPFIYRYHSLPLMSLIYVLDNNRELGTILRKNILSMARESQEFWVHYPLRPYNPSAPEGGLETAHLSAAMSIVMDMTPGLFDAKEKKEIIRAIREKGFVPCMRWLRNNACRSNWSAVISSQTLLTAKFLNDRKGAALAEKTFVEFLDLIETDGSYGEQIDYFEYPLRVMINAFIVMGMEKAEKLIRNSSLAKSLMWMSYYYFYNTDADGKLNDGKITFGDGDYLHKPSAELCYFLGNTLKQGVGTWLINEYYGNEYIDDFMMLFLKSMFHDQEVQPESPEKLGFPLVKSFENGLSVIRSSWGTDSIIMAMRSGGAARTNYTHDRPDRNSIQLSAYGEYFLVYPGRASYRSPLRNEWDRKTGSTNTLTFNGADQSETPVAWIKCAMQGESMDCLVSEASKSYLNNPKTVERTVLFIKDKNYFVIIDHARIDTPCHIELNFLFNNLDQKTDLKEISENKYIVKRPNASLLAFFAGSEKFYIERKKGIMHKGYSYYPGEPNEGGPGSSIKLQLNSSEKVSEIIYCTVLAPGKKCSELELKISSLLQEDIPRIIVEGGDFEDVFYLSCCKKCENIKGPPSAEILKVRHENGRISSIVALGSGNTTEL